MALGLDGATSWGSRARFTFNNPDPIVICNTAVCDQPIATGKSGSFRFFTPNDGFGLVAGGNTGTFYTDAHGKRLVSKGEAGAVEQYVRSGSAPLPGGEWAPLRRQSLGAALRLRG